ncbi:aminotransferase class V-fold PLP-dependent enzyme [Halobacteriovorax sp. DPLXC-1]|uniref:aminotransferase class V-fold PLP-dependent enzyme n=1 Tax=Halobacteriovorax sp. DPLXC-1 TaxID=3110771 RepID=UPI002FF14285
MYKKYFSKFLKANEGKLHFAAHSHHYWPNVTREAQIQYWDDSAKYADHKWGEFFSNTFRELQTRLAEILNISSPEQITFAPNTHELTYRLLSCFPNGAKILTTDSEFYSFDRQINRLAEENIVSVTKIKNTRDNSFINDFIKEANSNKYDLIFISHVFFNSGYAIPDLTEFINEIKTEAPIVIDAYHGFMALPTDLSAIEDRIFYMAGGYKYCGSGEGSCFLISPRNTKLKPKNTGWFAQMGELTNYKENEVPFSNEGFRFAGSTMDFSALYRMNAVLQLWKEENISVEQIHNHVKTNMNEFLNRISDTDLSKNLIPMDTRGHFLAFEFPNSKECESFAQKLRKESIETDYRQNILRFGFSIYQDIDDIIRATNIINNIK